jgi:hypothetical protein
LLVVIAAFGTSAVVRAQDAAQVQEWPRFYIGVAVGLSDLQPDWSSVGVPEHLQPITSLDAVKGWKAVVGFRPARVVGAEIEYIDFGSVESGTTYSSPHQAVRATSFYSFKGRPNAMVLTALLFIPDPSPSFDVYGKVGVAKLDESFNASYFDRGSAGCEIFPYCSFSADVDQTDWRPYVGFGARFKVARAMGVRVEYEAIDGDVGDPVTMLSVGFAWER